MKKLIYLLFLVIIIININSCATTAKYEEKLNSWVGSDINRLLMSWGTPSDVYNMPNGSKMYTWLWVGGTLITTNYNEYLNMISTRKVTYWCKTTFTADDNGKIIYWRWEGNRCVSD